MYEKLLAYDAACRELIETKKRIRTGIDGTEIAREVKKLDSELSALLKKKRQYERQLASLSAEFNSLKNEYEILMSDYAQDLEQQELDENDPETPSKTFESNRRDLETKLTTVRKHIKALMRIATVTDEIATDLGKVQVDGTLKFRLIKQKKSKLQALIKQEFEPLNALEERKGQVGSEVEPDLRAKYDNIAVSHPDPIAQVANGTCSGCRMSLPSSMVSKVTSGAMITCENCGRMIFNH